MSKKIVVIESDASFAQKLRAGLEEKGFSVEETPDGKVAVDLVRKEKPDLIVLSVELAAGQSGYIVCGKLKKDDDLKKIPIVIIGKDADGFEAHKRLKARAEDYLKKPFDPPALVEKIKDLIGLPAQADDLILDEDESLGLASLGEDEPLVEAAAEPPAAEDEPTRGGDPDLDMLDAAFDDLSEPAPAEQPVEAPPDEGLVEEPPALEEEPLVSADVDADSALDALQFDDEKPAAPAEDEIALDALEPMDEPPPEPVKPAPAPKPAPRRATPAPAPVAAGLSAADQASLAEVRSLRERVAELEARERELSDEVNSKANELEALRSTSGGKDKEYFALKEQNTKKDKEIVRLKQDLNEKEQEVIELREKENALEQKASELTTEAAKRDAQIKTLTQRTEAYAADRKKQDAAHNATKDELRQLSAKLATAQGELDQAQDNIAELQRDLESARQDAESARGEAGSVKSELDAARSELESAKAELETAKAELETAKAEQDATSTELAGVRAELEQLQSDHQAAQEESERLKAEAERVPVLEEEATGLRARIAEFEQTAARNEERVVKAYQKIKSDEKMREKTKKALAVAMQILEESAAAPSDGPDGADEAAAS